MRSIARAVFACILLAVISAPARAGVIERVRGHLSLGFTKPFSDSLAPGGSLSVAGGVDYPLSDRIRVGPVLGVHLLGSTTVRRGSFSASLDYSVLEGALQVVYLPTSGPLTRLAFGPALGSARADLSTAGGGAAFSDIAVSEVVPGLALDASAIPRRQQIVGVGIEAGLRVLFVEQGPWTLASARLAIHF